MSYKRTSVRWVFDCHQWCPSRHEWVLASTSIQSEEKERIGRFYFKRDAKNSMAGRLLMRKFLTTYSGLPWKDIIIGRGEHGKPYLINHVETPLNFNVSHHGNYTVLAGEIGYFDVGIDVMTIDYRTGGSLNEFLHLMRKQFSKEEWKTITKPTYSEREVCYMFYRIWCLKESYLKATGSGLSENMKDIRFDIKDTGIGKENFTTSTEIDIRGERSSNWTFHEIMIDENTLAAVAVSPQIESEIAKFQMLNFEEIVSEAEQIIPEDEEYCDNFFAKQNLPLPHYVI